MVMDLSLVWVRWNVYFEILNDETYFNLRFGMATQHEKMQTDYLWLRQNN